MRKKLEKLASLVEGAKVIGNPKVFVSDMVQDSREVTKGALFVCIKGDHFDGHDFINDAVKSGAAAIMTDRDVTPPSGTPILKVPDVQEAAKVIAPFAFGEPSKRVRLIGITGTNGKTTTSYLIRAILREAGKKVGLIGTIQTLIEDRKIAGRNTTPNVIDLQRTIARMADSGVEYVVMEVSSHALDQGRVAGCEFDTAIFTNLTQDHLDYHKTMENYMEAKVRLFDMLSEGGIKPGKTAVINIDDDAGEAMLAHSKNSDITTYGIVSEETDLRAVGVRMHSNGATFSVQGGFGRMNLRVKITGMFNVYNILAAVGAAMAEDIPMKTIESALVKFGGVPGRFELIDAGQLFTVVVDYAHTPDGLGNVLNTAREITENRLICVFGCGGDRDRAKRPVMGRIAGKLSDIVIVTSDNPRTEDPAAIIEEVAVGVDETAGKKVHEKVEDRREAIYLAISLAQAGDTVVIAGKGHEDYQILGDKKIHFDDREVAREALGGII